MSKEEAAVIERGVIVAVHHEGKLLLLRRCAKHSIGKWEFVAGKVEDQEYDLDAANRELIEEIGLERDDRDPLVQIGIIQVPSLADPTYTGPRKIWATTFFFVNVTNADSIHINEPHIHDKMAWIPSTSLLSVVYQVPELCLTTMMAQYCMFYLNDYFIKQRPNKPDYKVPPYTGKPVSPPLTTLPVPPDARVEGHPDCQRWLMNNGKSYPKTCPRCGLSGPCAYALEIPK